MFTVESYRVRLRSGLWLASNGHATATPRLAWTSSEKAAALVISALGLAGACIEIAKVSQ